VPALNTFFLVNATFLVHKCSVVPCHDFFEPFLGILRATRNGQRFGKTHTCFSTASVSTLCRRARPTDQPREMSRGGAIYGALDGLRRPVGVMSAPSGHTI
jgi:hypothetical protein